MRTIWVTPRHSRTSRVPGLNEIGGAGITEPRLGELAPARLVACEKAGVQPDFITYAV